ncbi:MAG: 30S ribosome-binding factor RbfA [Desulfobacteraceae bacterium]
MKPYTRSDRVGGLIQQVLAELLLTEISDPRLSQTTITAVKVSRDLRFARIYFATSGRDGAAEAAKEGFNRACGFVKRELAQRLGLRYMPDLKFFYDDAIDRGARMEQLIKLVKENDRSDH